MSRLRQPVTLPSLVISVLDLDENRRSLRVEWYIAILIFVLGLMMVYELFR